MYRVRLPVVAASPRCGRRSLGDDGWAHLRSIAWESAVHGVRTPAAHGRTVPGGNGFLREALQLLRATGRGPLRCGAIRSNGGLDKRLDIGAANARPRFWMWPRLDGPTHGARVS